MLAQFIPAGKMSWLLPKHLARGDCLGDQSLPTCPLLLTLEHRKLSVIADAASASLTPWTTGEPPPPSRDPTCPRDHGSAVRLLYITALGLSGIKSFLPLLPEGQEVALALQTCLGNIQCCGIDRAARHLQLGSRQFPAGSPLCASRAAVKGVPFDK